jgi:hypothetical protein
MTRPRSRRAHAHLQTDVIGWHRFTGLDGRKTNGNESATTRVIPAFESSRRTVSRVCDAILAHLFRLFRATDVCVFEGGGRRLPRAALGGCAASLCPGLTCFAPSGHWGFLGAWQVTSAPGPRRAIVLTQGKNGPAKCGAFRWCRARGAQRLRIHAWLTQPSWAWATVAAKSAR